jgi:hypothetical protein
MPVDAQVVIQGHLAQHLSERLARNLAREIQSALTCNTWIEFYNGVTYRREFTVESSADKGVNLGWRKKDVKRFSST